MGPEEVIGRDQRDQQDGEGEKGGHLSRGFVEFVADLFVEKKVIVELKSVRRVVKAHEVVGQLPDGYEH